MLLKATYVIQQYQRKIFFVFYGKSGYLIRRAFYILFCIISGCANGERGFLDTNRRLPDNVTTAVYWFSPVQTCNVLELRYFELLHSE
jgi:hypothetical protein